MKPTSNNIFNQSLPLPNIPHSNFDLSHYKLGTCKMGTIYPVFNRIVEPGSSFNFSMETFLRAMPLYSPIMQRVNVSLAAFVVPIRLLYTDWENFQDPTLSGYVLPYTEYGNYFGGERKDNIFANGSLMDYLGVQPLDPDEVGEISVSNVHINLLAAAAYQKVFWDCYKPSFGLYDDELDLDAIVPLSSGSYTTSDFLNELTILRRASWENDYFVAAAPTPQAAESVYLFNPFNLAYVDGSTITNGTYLQLIPDNSTAFDGNAGDVIGSTSAHVLRSTTTIDDLETLKAIEKYLNRRTVYGTRYIEQLAGQYGVVSSDARLQRAQYIGGSQFTLQVSEVTQTSGDASNESVLGDYAGRAIGYGTSNNIDVFIEEHSVLLVTMVIRPESCYMHGIQRDMLYNDPYDFAVPAFANLGEQPIYKAELDANIDEHSMDVFGYVPRYSEYKTYYNQVCAKMRTIYKDWHLARDYSNNPVLSYEWEMLDEATGSRIFNDTSNDSDNFMFQIYFDMRASRPLPYQVNLFNTL